MSIAPEPQEFAAAIVDGTDTVWAHVPYEDGDVTYTWQSETRIGNWADIPDPVTVVFAGKPAWRPTPAAA